MVEINVKYYTGEVFTHSYKEVWRRGNCHCPMCGEKGVWQEDGKGDYYVGSQLMCAACGFTFYMPIERFPPLHDDPYHPDCQRLAALRKS